MHRSPEDRGNHLRRPHLYIDLISSCPILRSSCVSPVRSPAFAYRISIGEEAAGWDHLVAVVVALFVSRQKQAAACGASRSAPLAAAEPESLLLLSKLCHSSSFLHLPGVSKARALTVRQRSVEAGA